MSEGLSALRRDLDTLLLAQCRRLGLAEDGKGEADGGIGNPFPAQEQLQTLRHALRHQCAGFLDRTDALLRAVEKRARTETAVDGIIDNEIEKRRLNEVRSFLQQLLVNVAGPDMYRRVPPVLLDETHRDLQLLLLMAPK